MNDLKMFTTVLGSQVSFTDILIVLALSALLGFAVSFVYQRTARGLSYSTSFVMSLILLNVITAIVMLVVGSNLARAFGLVGALSIIRFRTAIKDPRDISFIFLSLVLGISVGTQNYHIAVLAGLFILFLIYVLDQKKYGVFINNQYFLTLDISDPEFSASELDSVLGQFASEHILNSVNAVYNNPNLTKRVYKVSLYGKKATELLDATRVLEGVKEVSILSAENYVTH